MPSNRKAPPIGIGWILTLILVVFFSVAAQAAQLFVPIQEPRAADIRPEQNQLVEQIKKLKTTKSLSLVRINLEALKQDTVDLNLRGDVTSKAVRQRIDKRLDTDFT